MSTPQSLPHRIWGGFATLKTGIVLLSLIGVACIYGTTQFASNGALGDNAIPLAKAKVFNAPWFFALLALFAINLIVTTWHVTKTSFTIWWRRDFKRHPAFYPTCTHRAEIDVPGGPAKVEEILRRRFTTAHRDGNAFFAQKGILSRLGPTIVHAGMLLILGAGMVRFIMDRSGMILSEGRFMAAEGEMTNRLYKPIASDQAMNSRNMETVTLPVFIRVLDFDEEKFPNSDVPAYFSSTLEVTGRETGESTIAKLDMNHSFPVGAYEFHQAGYQPLPPIETHRTNLDVRRATTGERVAITDITPGLPAQVGTTDLYIVADGESVGDAWRMFDRHNPDKVIAKGTLEPGPSRLEFRFEVTEVYPDFRIDPETKKPSNGSDELKNPAVHVKTYLGDKESGETWLFMDRSLARQIPDSNPYFRLVLQDIQLPDGVEKPEWNSPGAVRVVVGVQDIKSGTSMGREFAMLGERSVAYPVPGTSVPPKGPSGTELGEYRVRTLGNTTRFVTILSVVTEPVVPFYIAGVIIIAMGAGFTFLFPHRSCHALWDEASGKLHIALVPRWAQSPVEKEWDALLAELKVAS